MSTYETNSPADDKAKGRARPDREGPMTEEDLQTTLEAMLTDAVQYSDNELSPDRATATEYYLGKPLGNEEQGRSQVVLTEVRDAVQGVIPSLMKVFFGPERIVEFTPRGQNTVQQAAQATDYVQYVFTIDNPGFLLTHSVLLDGLVRKLGVFKWCWDEPTTSAEKLKSVTQSQLELLANDPEVELRRISPCDYAEGEEPCFNVELTRTEKEGCARVYAVPPDEFLYSREARGVDDALIVVHRTEKTRSELIELGVDKKLIDEYGHRDLSLQDNVEVQARQGATTDDGANVQQDPDGGDANDKITYCEAYPYIDFDGDGIAELRQVCTIGPTFKVVTNTPCDERPFALWCPSPEPHTITGQSWADRVADMQRVKSAVLRGILDSGSASIFPRMGYVEGQVAVEDILNNEIGAPIRQRAPNMVQAITTPFIGKEMFPILEYCDEIVERRTGQNKGTAGLDADALQSSTKSAVNAAVSASQAQAELLARLFAEMALKPLCRGLLRLLVKYQPKSRLVRLRNQWVNVDPRAWDADMDMTVNVALGAGFTEDKIATLMEIAAKQEQVIAQYGPSNPLVSVGQYRNTLARMIELKGFKDTDSFFNPVPADWQPPPQQPQESPEQVLAKAQLQIEQMRTQKELEIKQAELALKQRDQEIKHQIELKKLADDYTLRLYAINAQFGSSYSEKQLELDADAQSRWLDGQIAARQQQHAEAVTAHERALAEQQQAHDQALAQDQQAHDQAMAERAAAAQEQAATTGDGE